MTAQPRTATKKRAQSNREAWLTEVVRAVRPSFTSKGIDLPPVRVSVGWPGGRRSKGTVLGQCWSAKAATDGRAQIFVSPIVSDGRRAVDILIHELAHAADHNEHGHTAQFAAIATKMGLEGKPTHTHAGPDLAEKASALVKRLGKYPHAALDEGMTDGTKKQGTRMIKVICECPEPRILRLSQKNIDAGPITCGICDGEFLPEGYLKD
jgi:SprT-like family